MSKITKPLSTNNIEEFIYEATNGVLRTLPSFLIEEKNNNIYLLMNSISRIIYELINFTIDLLEKRNCNISDNWKRLTGNELNRIINNFSNIYLDTTSNINLIETESTFLKRFVQYFDYVDGSEKQINNILNDLLTYGSISYISSIYESILYYFDGNNFPVYFVDPDDTSIYRFISQYSISDEQLKILITSQLTNYELINIYQIIRFFLPKGIIFTIEVS